MSGRRVNIHIERLVVAGPQFTRRETAQFRMGFERELDALLHDRPPQPARSRTHRRLESPEPIRHASKHPAAFGVQVARQVFGALRSKL